MRSVQTCPPKDARERTPGSADAATRRRRRGLLPPVQDLVDADGGGEVLVDQVQDELGGVARDGLGAAEAVKVRRHPRRRPKVRDAPRREDQRVVEAGEDRRARLVDRADDDDLLLLGDLLEEGHHARGARAVDAGRGLVEEQHLRLLRQRHRDRQPPLQPAAQPADELVARARVLLFGQPDAFEDGVDGGGARGRAELGLEEGEREVEVLPRREHRPQRVILLHVLRRRVSIRRSLG